MKILMFKVMLMLIYNVDIDVLGDDVDEDIDVQGDVDVQGHVKVDVQGDVDVDLEYRCSR